jgi:DNA-binding NarL/FixJ family response regulator
VYTYGEKGISIYLTQKLSIPFYIGRHVMTKNNSTRVVLADDHVIVRQGLRKLLEESGIEVIGEASDGLEAVKLVETLQPEFLICDINMGAMNGLEVTRRVAKQFPQIKVIVLSMYGDDSYVIEALRAGAIAYVLKGSSSTDLLQAIQDAIVGKHYLSSTLSERAIGNYIQKVTSSSPEPFDTLSIREREVMQMVVQGMTSAEIGKKLFISPRTVDIHRANIMRKLGLKTRIDLVQIAQRQGILPPEFEINKN